MDPDVPDRTCLCTAVRALAAFFTFVILYLCARARALDQASRAYYLIWHKGCCYYQHWMPAAGPMNKNKT